MKVLKGLLYIIILLILWLAYNVWDNNCCISEIDFSELKRSNEKAIVWLMDNEEKVVSQNNSMLWWMIKESARISGDVRLAGIFNKYLRNLNRERAGSPWFHLFKEDYLGNVSNAIFGLPDYNVHFLYSLTCDDELASLDIIKRQNKTDFCWAEHPLGSACVTHQLMAFRFMERRSCGDKFFVARSIDTLQQYIKIYLLWDFRVVDVYLQRVLMLAESGAIDEINASWVRRIISAQLEDGGWSNFHPLFSLGNDRYFGFTSRGIGIRANKSSFHATVQGIFLTTILASKKI